MNNRRDTGYNQRKTSRPIMRKIQTCRIFRIWPEARSLKFWVPDYHCLDPWTAEISGQWPGGRKSPYQATAIKNTEGRQ